MKVFRKSRDPTLAFCVAALASMSIATSAGAGVVFQTGNQQYTNVNIAADVYAMTVSGEVDHSGVFVDFNGFGEGPAYNPVELHGQHGVAFLEVDTAGAALYRMTMTAQSGWAFNAADWKLDAVPPNDGWLKFVAYDAGGAVIPLSSGVDTFFFDHNGQNPFNVSVVANGGSLIKKLEMTSISVGGSAIAPILDLKQVSVDIVPVPLPVAVWAGIALLGSMAGAKSINRLRRQEI